MKDNYTNPRCIHPLWWVGGLILLIVATAALVLAMFMGFGADLRF